jgi:hypothetical protein
VGTALSAAVRRPGWTFALVLDAVAAVGGFATVRWGPTGAVELALSAAAVLIAAATASLCDDDLVDLTCTSPVTVRRRTVARLLLGVLAAAVAATAAVAGLAGAVPRDLLGGPLATMALVVAVGIATGVVAARVRPDVPAAIPAALLVVAVLLGARRLTLDVLEDSGARTACAVLVAGVAVLVMTRDRAAPRRLPSRRGPSA